VGLPKSELLALDTHRLTTPTSDETSPSPAPASQAALLSGVVAGERWAHEALYDLLYPAVARTLHKILRDPSRDYEDLVQTTFERIVRTLQSERGAQIGNLSGWAGAIAAHVALDALRSRMRERRLFQRESDERAGPESLPAPSLERQLEARKQLEWLQKTLARMNRDQAQTVLLHDVLGHGLNEVAAMTGVTVAAAQRRLSRGHQELLRRAKVFGIKGER
jgi:RNA polymerase sigma-70 factor (ECF subfamily)